MIELEGREFRAEPRDHCCPVPVISGNRYHGSGIGPDLELLAGRQGLPSGRQDADDQFAQFFPGVFDLARASRYFIVRIVRYLAGEAGIRQFLDSRIVYVDNDPLMLAHARALLAGNAEDSTDHIDADLNEPDALLAVARESLTSAAPSRSC